MSSFRYVRIFTGSDGLSHFQDVDVPLTRPNPSAASLLSRAVPAGSFNFRESDVRYDLDYHLAGARQFVLNLTGQVEIRCSDGEVRVFGPGSVMLTEDLTGKGHTSRNIGDEVRYSIFIQVPDDWRGFHQLA
jgi:hypothetical protein